MGRSTCFSCGGSGRVERVEQGSPYDGTNYYRYFDNCSHCHGKGYSEYDDPYSPSEASSARAERRSHHQADPDEVTAKLIACVFGAGGAYILHSQAPTASIWVVIAAFVAPLGIVYYGLRRMVWLTKLVRYAALIVLWLGIVLAIYVLLRNNGQVPELLPLEWLRSLALWIVRR